MKRATVVGGSLTGLAAGILLRKIGWEVNIFERSPQSLSDRGAGIVLQQETLELLRLCGAKRDGDVGVTLSYRKYLDASGSVASSDRMPQLMTSWGLLYSWFERNFPVELVPRDREPLVASARRSAVQPNCRAREPVSRLLNLRLP